MKGLRLSSLSWELHKLSPDFDSQPATSIASIAKRFGEWGERLLENTDDDAEMIDKYHALPLEAFAGFTFEELCMLKHSSKFRMSSSVRDFFERNVRHEVIQKITNSMWRWSFYKSGWNEIVEIYDRLRHFTFSDDPNFEVRLDYTTYHNEYGHAKFSRVYIDGTFAYLVYYKRKHIMTIGFSLAGKSRILIQQVQSAKQSGNRYLYKLPKNRLEFVIELFRKNFPTYSLYLIDGKSLVKKTLADYQRTLTRTLEHIKAYRKENSDFARRMLEDYEKDCATFEQKIAHLEADKARLIAFYSDTGRFKFGRSVYETLYLVHRQIVAHLQASRCRSKASEPNNCFSVAA
ncbi:MAG: hypothetical protein WC250_00005 [Candidatus Paceibacterota bacterium]|jgi:hypothetical protein